MSKEVVASYPVKCSGPYQIPKSEIEATISIYNDGSRDVGCPLMDLVGQKRGTCLNTTSPDPTVSKNCVHLYPLP